MRTLCVRVQRVGAGDLSIGGDVVCFDIDGLAFGSEGLGFGADWLALGSEGVGFGSVGACLGSESAVSAVMVCCSVMVFVEREACSASEKGGW